MSSGDLAATYIEGRRGRLLVVHRCPAGGAHRGFIVIVPPFAEEMNKSRRMMALMARNLAEHGIAAVIPDLYGTGDSDGEFAGADWDCWVGDLQAVVAWAQGHYGSTYGIVAIRLGSALAAAALRAGMPAAYRTALWQPVFDGNRALEQFLRLRVAASMFDEGGKETVSQLRSLLAAGENLDVAGYQMSSALATQMSRERLSDGIPAELGEVCWFEIVRSADATPSTASAGMINTAVDRGIRARIATVLGQPFWAANEIVEIPELVSATAEYFSAT